jgi:formylglycine-generating enzyme required for sulfatase activity
VSDVARSPGDSPGPTEGGTEVPDLAQTLVAPTPGRPTADPQPLSDLLGSPRKPGSLELGHFDVLETIGRGGFGIVVKAYDRKLQREVAIKMMSGEMAATSPARKRFVREARAAAAVRHDNVVHIYAVEEQPTPYLVMEYVPGGSLQQHLDRTGPLDVPSVLRIGAQIARGLAAAHDLGLIHRDVKPGNVLLEPGEHPRAKLSDFGLARAADDASLSQSGAVPGTPMYMAPEQARGERLDHRADLYSLGSVLYVMATGRPPFRAANTMAVLKRVAEDEPRPVREIIPEVPQWLCDVLTKLHAKDPVARFQSAREVAELLERCLADLLRDGVVSLTAPAPARRRRVRWPAVAAAVLACGVLGGVVGRLSAPAKDAVPAAARSEDARPPAGVNPPAAVPLPARYTNRLGMEFALIPAGTSRLGGRDGNPGDSIVEIPHDFYLGVYEVTQEEWAKVMGPAMDPSRFARTGAKQALVADIPDAVLKRFPVNSLSWDDCQRLVSQLNRQAGEAGWVYRLPRSAEWEYACRGGPGRSAEELGFDFYAGEPSYTLRPDRANGSETGMNRPCKVGSFPPNRLGLHDMHGNVFELCDDREGSDQDPLRIVRGGFWADGADHCRAGTVSLISPGHQFDGGGLRLARVPAGPPQP